MTKLAMPAGFERQGNRVVKSSPRAEGVPPGPPEEPAAADMTCPKCGAAVQAGWKYCPECGTEQAAPPNDAAPPADAQAFARHALSLTGVRSLDAARGILASWRKDADEVATLREGHAASTKMAAFIQRDRLLEQAVADGRLTPSEAWSFDVNDEGEKVRTFSEWAGPPSADGKTGQSFEQLQAFVSRRAPSSAMRPVTAERATASSGNDEHARRTGRDPAVYAQIEKTIQARRAVEVT